MLKYLFSLLPMTVGEVTTLSHYLHQALPRALIGGGFRDFASKTRTVDALGNRRSR